MRAVKRHPLRPLRQALAASALVLAAPLATAVSDPKASRYYEDALTRYEKKDVGGAIVQLKNALQLDREMLPAHVLLGKALLANGEMAAAEVAFVEALRLGVNRAEVVVPLAQVLITQGKQDQLLQNARFASTGLPPGVQAPLLLMRAAAASDVGDTRGALRFIEEARAIDGGSAESWLAEVPVRIRARQLKEAEAAVDKALARAPESADAWYQRGALAQLRGDAKGTLAAYDRVLAARPEHVEARIARAGLLVDLNRGDDAKRDLVELATRAPKEPRVAWLRALLAERDGDKAAARAAMTEITTLLDPLPIEVLRYRPQVLMLGGLAHFGLGQPQKAKPYLETAQRQQAGGAVSKLLAQILIGENNHERAIESLEVHLKSQPGDAQALSMLSAAHVSLGRPARAVRLMQDALKSHDVPMVRAALGLALAASGHPKDALPELEAAWRKDPALTQAGTALVGLYVQTQQAQKAVLVAEALVKRQPADPVMHQLLGSARARAGDVPGARKAYEQALALDARYIAPRVGLAQLDASARAWDAANGRLSEALTLDEKHVDVLSTLATIAEARGQNADAQRWFEKAADHAGTDLRPAIALVDFHLRSARPPAALEALKRLNAKSEDVSALVTAARVYLANDNVDAARGSLVNATRVAAFDAPLQVQIALLQLAARNLPGAAYSTEKALQADPEFLPAQALMGDIEIRQGELARGEQRARQLVARHPRLAVGHSLLGAVAAARNQGPAAIEAYRRAHQLEPSTDSVLRLFNVLAVADRAGALLVAEQWLRQKPADRLVRKAVGDLHARGGQFAAARTAYEAVLRQAPGDVEALNNLANVLVVMKDPAALKTAEAALALQPNNPNLIDTAGWAAFNAGQKDRALQLLRDARLRDPASPEIRFHLATALADSGRRTEAREELDAALKSGRPFHSEKQAQALLDTLR